MAKSIEEIKEVIGQNKPDDYILSPENHYNLYKDKLPSLANLLNSAPINVLAKEYKREDQKAIESQNKFKKFSTYARWFTFLSVAFSSILIMAGSLSNNEYVTKNLTWLPQAIVITSTILTLIFTGISGAFIRIIKTQKLLEKWMEKRASAEEYRLKYFNELANLSNKDSQMEVLIYFKRYLLDMQITYYGFRSTQLGNKADKVSVTIAILAAVIFIVNGIAGVLSSQFGMEWTSLVALALIVQAWSFKVSNEDVNDQSTRNAERYSRTRAALVSLSGQVDQVGMSIQSGNMNTLMKYIQAVNEPISVEHRQWLKNMESSSIAISELEKELKKTNNTE